MTFPRWSVPGNWIKNWPERMKLSGRNVLITGAARRIGREIALTLAGRGANLLLHYRDSRREARGLQEEIRKRGVRCEILCCDFSPRGGAGLERRAAGFIQKAERKLGPLDVLIHNASLYFSTVFGEVREKSWDELLGVNLKTPFFLSQAAGRLMFRRKCGKIINLTDSAVANPANGYAPYTISKAGLAAMTICLARELAPHVQVNAVAPGPILPPPGMKAPRRAKVTERTLLKRFGTPADIAQTVLYLIEGTDYVTGAVIPVDGGCAAA